MDIRRLKLVVVFLLLSLPAVWGGKRVLFIGDSVTDGGWGNSGGSAKPSAQRNHWDQNHIYGHSYMMLCAAHFQSVYPEEGYEFFNRGISGDDLSRLEERWEEDVIALKPDVVSLLIGTNDVSRYLEQRGDTLQFDSQGWERRYRELLHRTRSACPDVKFVLATPFVAQVGKVGAASDYALRDSLIHRLSDIIARIAQEFDAGLVRYDRLFASQPEAHPTVPMSHWIWDGIHPTAAGHRLMADLWIRTITIYRLF